MVLVSALQIESSLHVSKIPGEHRFNSSPQSLSAPSVTVRNRLPEEEAKFVFSHDHYMFNSLSVQLPMFCTRRSKVTYSHLTDPKGVRQTKKLLLVVPEFIMVIRTTSVLSLLHHTGLQSCSFQLCLGCRAWLTC